MADEEGEPKRSCDIDHVYAPAPVPLPAPQTDGDMELRS